MPQLEGNPQTIASIRKGILNFVGDDEPEFWGYFVSYDWFLFCRIFGGMLQLPDGWPQLCFDIKQLGFSLGHNAVVNGPHHALEDAVLTWQVHKRLTN